MGPRELVRAARVALRMQDALLAGVESRGDVQDMTAEEHAALEAVVGVGKQAHATVAVRLHEFETPPPAGAPGRPLMEGDG